MALSQQQRRHAISIIDLAKLLIEMHRLNLIGRFYNGGFSAYLCSWLVGAIVDKVADDLTMLVRLYGRSTCETLTFSFRFLFIDLVLRWGCESLGIGNGLAVGYMTFFFLFLSLFQVTIGLPLDIQIARKLASFSNPNLPTYLPSHDEKITTVDQ